MKEQIGLALIDAIESIKNSDLLTGATLLAVMGSTIAVVWSKGKSWFNFVYKRIERLIMFRVTIEFFDDMYWYLETWLQENHSGKYRNVVAYLDDPIGFNEDEAPIEQSSVDGEKPSRVKYKHHSDFIVIKHNKHRLYILKSREKNNSATTLKNLFYDSFSIKTIFGRNSVRKFLDMVVQYNLDKIDTRTEVGVYTWLYGRWQPLKGVKPKTLDHIFMNEGKKESILNDFNSFLSSEKDYITRGIPYKRGYMFHGPPGNGKTTLAAAIAHKLGKNLYSLNLTSMNNDNDLVSSFMELPSHDAIILIEDIDTMFVSERKMDKKDLNFSTLLNCLDGVFYRHGMISIMTTNHIDRLDNAMIRKGRIDMMVEITVPNEETAKRYIENFYEGQVTMNGELSGINLPMSAIQEMCINNDHKTIKKAILEEK